MPDIESVDRQLAAAVPADVVDEIAAWQTETARQIVFEHWLELGNTSARVAVVGVVGAG